jgi:hypothetical protein
LWGPEETKTKRFTAGFLLSVDVMLTHNKHVIHWTVGKIIPKFKASNQETATALQADIEIWEPLVRYVERSVDLSDKKKSSHDDTRGLRERIVELRALIAKVKGG